MGKYIRKRLLQTIPIVFGITILTYFIMKLAPGGPLANMINPRTSVEAINKAKEALGLDKPILVQYWNWLKELFHLNFGYSTFSGQPVLAEELLYSGAAEKSLEYEQMQADKEAEAQQPGVTK